MRSALKFFLFMTGISIFSMSCDKVNDLQTFGNGSAPVLTVSAATIAPPASDSDKVALTLNWSFPAYATDSANMKYTIEMDSTGKNFARANTKVVTKALSASYTAKELNEILLAKGYAFNVPVDMDVRVISSYANNNERLTSNVLKVRMTPYKIPPKVALPTSGKLFLVGNATQGGWNNPVPTPSQEFTRIDETTFGGIFQLNGASEYLVLPVNGDWGNKYSLAGNTAPGLNAGGTFGFNFADNFPGPTAAGWYKIILDFQSGKYTVTPFTQQHDLPTELYIVGDATPGEWNNPVPVPSQKFTRLTSTKFEIASLPMTAGKKYLLLPTNGDWGKKFGSDGASANTKLKGTFKPEGGDMDAPDVSGNYKITIDFINNSYTLVKL
jgi:hypothetical protein